jgi:hypothetical protein
VRVRARRLHDGRGVGRRSQQEGKSRHRSSNEGQTMPAPTAMNVGPAVVVALGAWCDLYSPGEDSGARAGTRCGL